MGGPPAGGGAAADGGRGRGCPAAPAAPDAVQPAGIEAGRGTRGEGRPFRGQAGGRGRRRPSCSPSSWTRAARQLSGGASGGPRGNGANAHCSSPSLSRHAVGRIVSTRAAAPCAWGARAGSRQRSASDSSGLKPLWRVRPAGHQVRGVPMQDWIATGCPAAWLGTGRRSCAAGAVPVPPRRSDRDCSAYRA